MKINKVQEIIGYTFRNKELLSRALTHPSYFSALNQNYQKLEFLGDSILDFLVAEHLYSVYSDKSEGDLTRMRAAVVSKTALSKLVLELGLDDYALIGGAQTAMSEKMRSDIYEAIVAAIYLDGGMEAARRLVQNTAVPKITENQEDYTSILYEYAAKNGLELLFDTSEGGPSHKKRFYATVLLEGKEYGRGEAGRKKDARQNAAKSALIRLDKAR